MKDFILPDIGEGVAECEIVEWRVNEGEIVQEDQPVCEVMTDKALVEIPSIYSGKIAKLYYKKGDVAKVHKPLFGIEIEGQEDEPIKPADKKNVPTNFSPVKKIALTSPSVRRLAREMNIDINKIVGSGDNGRIYKEDVLSFNQQNVTEQIKIKPLTGIMAAMAKKMTQAVQTIPHFTLCEEIDVTVLLETKNTLKKLYSDSQSHLTIMPFLIKALSLTLKLFPQVNIQTNEECTEILYFTDHNIGIAIDSPAGLVVPNIKQCQHKSMQNIAIEMSQLIQDAKSGKLPPESMKKGTISISNIGMLGGTVAVPIINKPEATIVAIGKVQKLPRFDHQENITARWIMPVSWSADHRIIDGSTMAKFTNQWKNYLENPATMLYHLT